MKKTVVTKFKMDVFRLITHLSIPFLILLMIASLLYFKYNAAESLSLEGFLTILLIVILFLVPWLILFINHLKFAKGKALFLDRTKITFLQNGQEETILFSDIKKVTKYYASRMPWRGIVKWEIETVSKHYWVSSLTISLFNFERFFYDKTSCSMNLFPLL